MVYVCTIKTLLVSILFTIYSSSEAALVQRPIAEDHKYDIELYIITMSVVLV